MSLETENLLAEVERLRGLLGQSVTVAEMRVWIEDAQDLDVCKNRASKIIDEVIRLKKESGIKFMVCAWCNATFEAKRKNARTCSTACRTKMYQDNKEYMKNRNGAHAKAEA